MARGRRKEVIKRTHLQILITKNIARKLVMLRSMGLETQLDKDPGAGRDMEGL